MSNILITGAAGGIGRTLVERALARRDTVFAAVLVATDADALPASPQLHVVVIDMADSASVERGFEQIDATLAGKPLDAIVHCAAISIPGAIEVTPVEEFERTLSVNALGSLRVLKAAIPRLRGHGGRLVLVTSLWGRVSGALLGAYCASKHMIESLADTARRETAGMGLHIIVAEPGVVQTDMLGTQAPTVEGLLARMPAALRPHYGALYQRYIKLVGGSKGITPAQCAAGIERALAAPRPATRYRIGADSKAVVLLNWLLSDRWMDGLMAKSLSNKPVSP